MIENEFKIMLSQEQYEKLLAMYEWDEVITQINFYYDSKDLELAERGITCRVRLIGGKYFLQMKFPGTVEYSRVELEKPLDSVPDSISADELLRPENYADELPDTRLIGALSTTRKVHRFEGGEIDLDYSSYFDKADYEIEIEFTDENNARKVLDEIKEKLDIKPNSLVCTGKIHRFIDEYKKAVSNG